MTPRSYPWALLPRIRRGTTRTLSQAREAVDAGTRVGEALKAFADLVGAPLVVSVDTAGENLAPTIAQDTTAIRFSFPNDAQARSSSSVIIEAEAPLVAMVAARVTRRPPLRVVQAGTVTPAMAGAFAATLAAALRHAGTPVVAQPAYAEAAPLDAEPVTVVGLTVTLDGQATHARAFVPTSFLASDAHGLGRAALAALGDVPLPLSLVAHRTLLTAGEVATLRRGDVLLFGASWKLGPARNLNGPVWLASSSSERALKAHLDGARLVLREGTEELGWSPMADELDEAGVIAAAVGEVPVIVRVELGAATMKAVEWASLRPGDVVALGSKIGAPVTVRVSGLAVAEGDLVDLEGEVGVRIRRRLPKQP